MAGETGLVPAVSTSTHDWLLARAGFSLNTEFAPARRAFPSNCALMAYGGQAAGGAHDESRGSRPALREIVGEHPAVYSPLYRD